MLSFIIRRLLIIIPMALLVITLTWGLIRLAPGTFYSTEKKLPPAVEANIKKKYGLDQPVWKQYLLMLGNVTCRTKDADEQVRGGVPYAVLRSRTRPHPCGGREPISLPQATRG